MKFLKDLVSGGIEGIVGGADKIIDNFVADPNKKLEAKLALKELELNQEKSIRDFAIQYEGDASQVPKWILCLRSVIRPVITICLFFSFMIFIGYDIYAILTGKGTEFIIAKLPNAYWAIFGIVLSFWFGERATNNIVDRIKNK
ncbi:MAG: hypothetical protein GY787_01045 [Alteromonadales bacterium]|nr:hypothetical protein [Alteromonadales bacterium]